MRRCAAVIACFFLLVTGTASAAPSLDVTLGDDANEVQLVQVGAASGQFRLSFGAGGPGISETGDLGVAATSAQVETALNGLANVSSAGGSVSVSGAIGTGIYAVGFDGGPLAHTDVPLLVAGDGTTSLGGRIGSRILVQTIDPAGVNRADEQVGYTATVTNTGPGPTSGEVTLEVESPGRPETWILAASGDGWGCTGSPSSPFQAARAVCKRSDPLAGGSSYPPVEVSAALGADAPDHAVATATASCPCAAEAASAGDEFDFSPSPPFGIQSFEGGLFKATGPLPSGEPYRKAGGHPFLAAASTLLTTKRSLLDSATIPLFGYAPIEKVRRAIVDLPSGMVANPLATAEFCANISALNACPAASAVGAISLDAHNVTQRNLPIFAIEPEVGAPAQFFFQAGGNIYTLTTHLRPEDGYATSLALEPMPKVRLLALRMTLCNFGAMLSEGVVVGCRESTDPMANPRPLLTNPARCDPADPPRMAIRLDSWEHPGVFSESSLVMPPSTECDLVPFEPRVAVAPTSGRADSPSGLHVELGMPVDGLESHGGTAQASLDEVTTTLPREMSFNLSAANGLGACGRAEIRLGTDAAVRCPESAKIGTTELETPLLKEPLRGAVYLAGQGDVDGSAIGLYLVFESEERGVLIKMPARVEPDPGTGRLTLDVDDIPELPFSALRLHFAGGPRALLVAPPRCGGYEIESEMTPWTPDRDAPSAVGAVTESSPYGITEGPDGGACPSGALEPKLRAGTENAVAGGASPLLFRLSREDGSQRFSGLELTTPPGLTAYLRGIPYCPDPVLASIPSAEGSGEAQIADPSCPAASRIGTATLGLGAGPNPLFVDSGRAYLAGPYKGAPLSIALVIPAVIGPLDLGSVVVREALRVDPATAQITLESDPLPRILHGILLDVRDIRVRIDRPGLIHNPTDCDPLSIGATVLGADGGVADLSRRFQVVGCAALGFKPRLSVRFSGAPTRRGGHPRLRATLRAGPGEANVRRAAIVLPKTEYLDNSHIRGICTRARFAARTCPRKSVYGYAKAWSPLLDEPRQGPVYLRASDARLPDLVAALDGQFRIDLAGQIDSIHGRIRIKLDQVPDLPVSRVRLTMKGGRRGLLVNNTQLCRARPRAGVFLRAHNGKIHRTRPVVGADCGKPK